MEKWGSLESLQPLLGFNFPHDGPGYSTLYYTVIMENTWISELRFIGQTGASGEDGSHLSFTGRYPNCHLLAFFFLTLSPTLLN